MMNKFGKELGEYIEFLNMSRKEFAARISTSQKNLIDIINGDVELSQDMIYKISLVTDIPVNYIENVEKNFKLNKLIDLFLKNHNLKINEYIKRYSIKESEEKYSIDITDSRDSYSVVRDLMRYLRISNLEQLYIADNSIFYKSKNDKVELLALWLERCYKLAMKQNIGKYKKDNINVLVSYIRSLAEKNIFDEKLLVEKFNENGVFLVIEDDLSGSKIRGAFKVLNDKPAIYLTRKHKRIADIYFALFHELAHLKSDYSRAKSGSLISFDKNDKVDYELKADKQAFNWMVDDKTYNEIKKDYQNVPDEVIKAFFAYRLAHDGIISYQSKFYQNNNILINLD